ncbi:MAG TPA: hypothetical protein VFN62_03965 [Acidobacteriaceae bacterium]|nr:hypothetical protein [Acidobacteriaceae bacterium]
MSVLSNLRPIVPEPESARLNSWKEIAAYLQRDPRTVQLWEKNEGLPVHRLAHNSRSSVYAFTPEIDQWLKDRSGKPLASPEPSILDPIEQAALFSGTRRRTRALIRIATPLVLLATVAGVWRWYSRHPAAAAGPTIAILPFESATAPDLLADGLTDSVIDKLVASRKMAVISGNSMDDYSERNLPLTQIATEAHAAWVLRGRVSDLDNQASVTVELIDGTRGSHVWGKTFVFETTDATASEDHIADLIATAVSEHVRKALAAVRTEPISQNPKVLQAYQAGRYLWSQRSLSGLQEAIAEFQQAIAMDPKFAPAYAGLADCYDLMTDRGVMRDDEAFRLAKQNARKAIALAPNSAEAYSALAFATYRQNWDFQSAEADFKKAIDLSPNDAVAHQWYGEFLGDLRRFDESIAELRKAVVLDPLSPMTGCDLADGYMHAGRYEEAQAELKRVLEMYPDFVFAHLYLHAIDVVQSNLADAESEAHTFQSLTGDGSLLRGDELRRLVAEGKMAEARAGLRSLLHDERTHLNSYQLSHLYFLTGQKAAGYAALDDALRQHSWWLVTMLVDPGFKPVENDPQFLDYARRVGLPLNTVSSRGQKHRG